MSVCLTAGSGWQVRSSLPLYRPPIIQSRLTCCHSLKAAAFHPVFIKLSLHSGHNQDSRDLLCIFVVFAGTPLEFLHRDMGKGFPAILLLVQNTACFPKAIPTGIGPAMSAVLTLTTASIVALSRMAWWIMMHRSFWLYMSQLPPSNHSSWMVPCPDGLFGPLLQSTMAHLHETAEEGASVRRLTFWSKATCSII